MSSPRLPIEAIRVVSLKKVWSSWAVFDSGGHWVWGKEDTLRQRYGKTSRIRIIDSATAAADVRMERVARIRAEIANGCYHVSSEDLAQKLIGVMLGGFR
jgi:hypothetical protein